MCAPPWLGWGCVPSGEDVSGKTQIVRRKRGREGGGRREGQSSLRLSMHFLRQDLCSSPHDRQSQLQCLAARSAGLSTAIMFESPRQAKSKRELRQRATAEGDELSTLGTVSLIELGPSGR